MLTPALTSSPPPQCILIESGTSANPSQPALDQNILRYSHSMAPIDLQELDTQYVVYVDTDYFPQKKLSVTLQDSTLTIKSLDNVPTLRKDANDPLARANQGFNICFLLPLDADSSTAHAYLNEDLLIVTMSKRYT